MELPALLLGAAAGVLLLGKRAAASSGGVAPSAVVRASRNVIADKADLVLRAAEEEFYRDVREPPAGNGARIDDYIRGPQGLGWDTAQASPWVAGVRYTQNGQFFWCGAFAAFCYGAAGLRADIRKQHFASTNRLLSWSSGTSRYIEPGALQPGDVVVMSDASTPSGKHIGICTTVFGTTINTIEGNANGTGPSGQRIEGVVRASRPLPMAATTARQYRIIFGVRPLLEDYV